MDWTWDDRKAATLDWVRDGVYSVPMSDAILNAPAGWLGSLTRSKGQLEAGQTVPLLPILDRLRASAEAVETDDTDDLRQTARS